MTERFRKKFTRRDKNEPNVDEILAGNFARGTHDSFKGDYIN